MKDSHLVIVIAVFVGLLVYITHAVSKISKLELLSREQQKYTDSLKIQKSDLEVKKLNLETDNQNLTGILKQYGIL